MSYVINQEILSRSILPPPKRLPVFKEWAKEQLAAMQRNNDLLNYYMDNFVSAVLWDSVTTYNRGDLVNGGYDFDQRIFESQQDSNTNNPLTDTDWWVEVSPSFIGVVERSKMWCSKIVMEYALNRWFGTIFRQPGADWLGPVTRSDIYIDTNGYVDDLFYTSIDEDNSSVIWPESSFGFVNITDLPGVFAVYQFTVYVPALFLAALPGGSDTVRAIVDKYAPFPLNFDIQSYV